MLLGRLLLHLHPLSLCLRLRGRYGDRFDSGHIAKRPIHVLIEIASLLLNARLVSPDAERADKARLARLLCSCFLKEHFLGLANFFRRLPGFSTQKALHVGLAHLRVDICAPISYLDRSNLSNRLGADGDSHSIC